MLSVPPLRFCFESFELDEATRELWRDGRLIGLQPRTLDLLAYLIRHRDHAVSKEQLLSSVWSGVVVNGEAVSRAVHLARKALGDDGRGQLFIRTVQRHGFRFVARVREAFPSSSLVRPAAAATSGTGGVDFVGRESIFTQLDRVLGEAAAGRGRLVLLRGEAGSGKTQTCTRFAARARERGARAFMGRAPREDEGAPPYWPWVQILGSLVEEDAPALSTRPADAACYLAQLVPTLRLHLPDLPLAPRLPPKRSRFRLFDSVIAFLRSAAREAPLVLVIDDLHCADSASLLLLAFLARELEDLRALVIGTYREEEVQAGSHLAECLADLCREAAVERMQLDGLSPGEVALLVERMSGRQVSGELCSALHRKTVGNPFFTAELVRFLESSGQLDRAGATAVSRLRLPRTVSAVVGRRIARLTPGTRRILQVAAVVGTRFDVRVLRSAFPGVSAESLEEAVEQGVLLEQPDEVGVFQFRHELVRDTIEQSLGAATRTRLHRRVAEALEALRGAGEEVPSATLAHHSFEAVGGGGDAHKALSYAIQAGRDAVARTAYGPAAHHYDRALRALDLLRDASEHQRCELLIELGHTQLWAGDLGGSRQTLERAAALAKRIGAPRLLARAALAIERDRLDQPFDALQVRLLREALACLPPEEEALHARLLTQLAIALYWSEQTQRSGRLSARAVALARRAGDSEALGWALSARYLALLRPGLERRRHALAQAMQRAARETRSSDLALIAAGVAYGEALERGEPRRAREAVAAVRNRVGVAALPQALLLPPALAASLALLEGNLERAELLGREVLTLGERLGDPLGRMIFVAQLGALRYQQERLAELEGAIREVLLRETDLLTALAILALAQCQSGREVLARDTFERALANELRGLRRDANWSITVAALAEVAARLRDRRRAALLYDLLLPHANRNVVVMLGIAFCGPISRYLGLLAGTLGRADEAVGRLGQGARAMRHLGARAWLARIHAEYALALLRRGRSEDRRAAARALASARRASERLGLAGPCATHRELEQGLRASGMDVS